MNGYRAGKYDNSKNCLVLDLKAAIEAVGGNERLLQKMAVIFYDDMPRMAEVLRDALEDGNIRMITQHAHTIKGASDNIKARMLSETVVRVEKAMLGGRADEAFNLFKKLEIELEKVRKAMLESGLVE